MEKLHEDILRKIETDYKTNDLQEYVIEKLLTISSMKINVGIDQLLRCILIIANGNINKFNELFESNFYGDPRDLIMEAMAISNNETYYGIKSFKKTEKNGD